MNIYNSFKGFFNRKGLNSNYIVGEKGAYCVDVSKPYELYQTIPQLKAVIDMKAQMFSNMRLKLIDKQGFEIIDEQLNTLLNNPNAMQSQNSWLKQWKIQEQVYGNQFVYANKPSRLSKYPTTLNNVSAMYLKLVLTGKVFEQNEVNGIISGYEYTENGIKRTFDVDTIMFSKVGGVNDSIIGVSSIVCLAKPLSNIASAYQFRNIIMNNKGALGILSSNNKDNSGILPVKAEDRKMIQNEYQKDYGIGDEKMKVLITDTPISWQPMSYPTKDLMLFEEIDTNTLAICDVFGLNANIFSNKNSTFENVKASIIQAYQDTIIPEADSFCQSLTKFLKLQNGMQIVPDFSHISVLKADDKAKADVLNSLTNSVISLVNGGVISALDATEIINENTNANIVLLDSTGVSSKLSKLSPLVANNVIGALTINEIRAIAGLPKIENGDVLQSKTPTF